MPALVYQACLLHHQTGIEPDELRTAAGVSSIGS